MKNNNKKILDPRLHILNIMLPHEIKQRATINGPAQELVPEVLNGHLSRNLNKISTSKAARRSAILNGCGCNSCDQSEPLINKGPPAYIMVVNFTKRWLIQNKPNEFSEAEALEIGQQAQKDFLLLPEAQRDKQGVPEFVDKWLINNGYNETAIINPVTNKIEPSGSISEENKKYIIYGGAALGVLALMYVIFKKK